MRIRVGSWVGVGVVLLGVAAIPWLPLRAQNFPGPYSNLTAGGVLPLPPPPPRGAWGEVIMANDRWIVVQNHDGQQFPISASMINQFLVRWPYAVSALSPQSWVEAIGMDQGSNVVLTDHIDVYEGTDRSLVQPVLKSILPTNQAVTAIDPTFIHVMTPYNVAAQNQLYGWAYPVNSGVYGIPGQLYVVGNVTGVNPIRLGIPGNNMAAVAPNAGTLTVTQVTRGTPSLAKKGDIVYLTPMDVNAKSLVLSQLVLYKKVPLSQYSQ